MIRRPPSSPRTDSRFPYPTLVRSARRALHHRYRAARRPVPSPGRRGMSRFARTDTSLMGRWWWTVDRWTLLSLISLMGFGALLMLAASPAAAERIGLQS